MPMYAAEIEQLLRISFPDANIIVHGDDGIHMTVEITASQFVGKNRIEQQRMVYAALGDKMKGNNAKLHALSLITRIMP